MQQNEMIPTEEYAKQSHTDMHFINQLREFGLIEIVFEKESPCIPSHQLPLLEKYARLHYDLDINFEGIEAISHLLSRIEMMHNEMNQLKNTLRLYTVL